MIVKKEKTGISFLAYEQSRKLSKGLAEFLGIKPEDIGWESIGDIILTLELENFPHPIQVPLGWEELDRMIKNRKISQISFVFMLL